MAKLKSVLLLAPGVPNSTRSLYTTLEIPLLNTSVPAVKPSLRGSILLNSQLHPTQPGGLQVSEPHRPRIGAELTQVQADRLFHILPHGWKKPLFQALVDGVLALYDKGGIEALGAIISGHISLTTITDLAPGYTRQEQVCILKKKLMELDKELKKGMA